MRLSENKLMKRYAALDIGSQTIRLLVAEYDFKRGLIPVCRDRSIICLARGMNKTGMLALDSIERAVECISGFIEKAKKNGATEIYPVATACVRDANNAHLFIDKVCAQTGIIPSVVSGEEEAALAVTGALTACNIKSVVSQSLIIDIGGGSTEITIISKNRDFHVESISLGVIGLSEKYLLTDPPLPDELRLLVKHVSLTIENKFGYLQNTKLQSMIGIAGTITTLAAMDLRMNEYEPKKINRHVLKRNAVNRLLSKTIALPLNKRSLLPGLETERALTVIPGIVILLAVMDMFNISEMTVSSWGILEGILLQKSGSSGIQVED